MRRHRNDLNFHVKKLFHEASSRLGRGPMGSRSGTFHHLITILMLKVLQSLVFFTEALSSHVSESGSSSLIQQHPRPAVFASHHYTKIHLNYRLDPISFLVFHRDVFHKNSVGIPHLPYLTHMPGPLHLNNSRRRV